MRLMIINPDWGMTREQMDARCRILKRYVGNDVELSMECPVKTKVCLDSLADAVLVGTELLEMTVRSEQQGYDAVVLYCFSDPVLEACRQVADIPVVGAGQAACLLIPTLGYHGAILLADKERIPEKRISLSRTGLSMERICGFEAIQSKGLDPIRDREKLKEELLVAGRRALENTDAQVLVLGCLSFLGLSEELGQELSVPVIDAGPASVCFAEILARQGLRSSKKAYLKYNFFN